MKRPVFLSSIFCFLWLLCSLAWAQQNVIQAENAKPGTPDWDITAPSSTPTVEGYASHTSVNRGETIQFFVSSSTPTYTLAIYRMGWYGGAGARLMSSVTLTGSKQPTPQPDPVTGLIECDWPESYRVTIPQTADKTDWATGIYLAKLTPSSGTQSYMIFVVRDDASRSTYVYQSTATTSQAYNNWGGKSLYTYNSVNSAPARKVSFNRPYARDGYRGGAGQFLNHEINFVRFLERDGYDVSYLSNLDLHTNGAQLLNHRAFLVAGHDEYWSYQMKSAAHAAQAQGVHLGFFASNEAYWQVRFEPSSKGQANRTMVAYKEAAQSYDPLAIDGDPSNDKFITIRFRDLKPIFGVEDSVAQPENGLVGVMYHGDPFNGDIVVSDATSWVYGGSGMSNASKFLGLLGYENDTVFNNGYSPPQLRVIAESPDTWGGSQMATYTTESGSIVFATGSNQWSWGIDNYGFRNLEQEPAKQATRNVLARFGAAPIRTPSNVQATGASQAINLSWTAPAGASTFNVYRSLTAGAQGATAYRAGLSSPSFTDTGLAAGTTYFYTVTGANAVTESAQSGEVSAAATSTPPPPADNPFPILSSITPASAAAGGTAFTLKVTGTNFIATSKVRWNGTVRTTTYVSATQLSASIPASDLQAAGTAQVSVETPTPGGGTSVQQTFTVTSAPVVSSNPAPALSSLVPASATAGGAGLTLTVNGSNFVTGSQVRWNATDRTTTFVSATRLTVTLLAADTAASGTAQVTVFTPAPGGGTSPAQTFTVAAGQNLTMLGTIIAKITAPQGGGSRNLEVIRNGVMPPVGSANPLTQYDTYDGPNTAADDWIGYQYTAAQTFNRMVFQEGMHFSDGGWFKNLTVQVRQAGIWVNVQRLGASPAYPGVNNGTTFETYTLQFDAINGDAIRLYGAPGGSAAFISVGELQVYGEGTPVPSNPAPALSSLSPASAAAGSAGFTLTVNGSNFVAGSKVRWNGAERTTTFVSAARLTAVIPATDTAAPGTAQVSVFNPTPGGGVSLTQDFTVSAAQNLTTLGTIIAKITAPQGNGSRNLEVIRNGVMPPVGSANPLTQYDTYDGPNTAADDWIGYQYTAAQTFNRMVFQEGMHFSDGGWFKNLTVQVRQAGIWVNVQRLGASPAYPGVNNGTTFETYTLQFDAINGDAIRLYGAPGGSAAFISVGELLVFGP